MTSFYDFVSTTLADHKVTAAEVPQIRERLYQDGRLDLEDVKLLVELYCEALQRDPAFEDLFFSVLEQVVLEDGEIQPSEQFYLLKMIYSDRRITDRERNFLRKVSQAAAVHLPDFQALCDHALAAPATNWDVGGRV